jgi:hypothetical protein
LTVQITFAYERMRFAVSDSKNHWRMTILDDPDLVVNSDIPRWVLKKAAAMVVSRQETHHKPTEREMVYSSFSVQPLYVVELKLSLRIRLTS